MTTTTPDLSTDAPLANQLQLLLAVLFGVCIVTANVTAAKLSYFSIPMIGGVAIPAGFLAIAVAFLCSDLMSELYGKEFAHRVVNSTVIALGVAWLLIYGAILLPVAPFYQQHAAYTAVLGSGGQIITASVITTLVSQHVDVSVFHRIRSETGTGHRWLRNLGSTSVSQFIDTVLFITLSFAVFPAFFTGDPIWGVTLLTMIAGQYVMKLLIAVLDTPLFYLLTTAHKYRDQLSTAFAS